MRRILIALTLALTVGLGGCAKLQDAWTYATSTTVSAPAVYIAANSFDTLKVLGTAYLDRPRCNGKNGPPPFCRDPDPSAKIIEWVDKGTVARNTLLDFYDAHPTGEIGPQGAYDALTMSVDTLKKLFAQNGIKTGVPQ